jgi:hypothetical protein
MIPFEQFTDRFPHLHMASGFKKFYEWFNKLECGKIHNFKTHEVVKDLSITQPTFLKYLRYMRDVVEIKMSIQTFVGRNGYTRIMIY